MSTAIKAVIFDVYSTLFLNDLRSTLGTFAKICSRQNLPVDAETLWKLWKPVEMEFRTNRTNLENQDDNPPFKSYETAWTECFQQIYDGLGEGDASAATKIVIQDMGSRRPFAETFQALQAIQPRIRTAVLSNADDAYLLPLLQRHDLQFEAVLSSESVGAYKPHPRPFLKILEKLSLAPAEAFYVGDHLFDDVLGASKVGMVTVWINRNGAPQDPSLPTPDHTIKNLMELLELINHR
ncbi:MAG: HAD family hydrolase [Chloroflexi bacterium]|nr:HAD family hydrolase [Chloroflexota bacterium]